MSRGRSPSRSRSHSRSHSPGGDASRSPSPRKGYGSEGSAEAFPAMLDEIEQPPPRRGASCRSVVPRAAHEGRRRAARSQQQQQQQHQAGKGNGQGTGNGNDAHARVLEATESGSDASNDNF